MTLADDEFIRSFLLHTLHDAFHRICHYGFLDNGQRSARLALCRHLLDADPPALAEPAIDYREWYHQLTGHALDRHLLCDGSMPPQRPYAGRLGKIRQTASRYRPRRMIQRRVV